MELEATQAAGLVLGVKSYGTSDELDYHSAWDMIKVAAEAEHGLLKKRPALRAVRVSRSAVLRIALLRGLDGHDLEGALRERRLLAPGP